MCFTQSNPNSCLGFLVLPASRRPNSAEKHTTVSEKDSKHRELWKSKNSRQRANMGRSCSYRSLFLHLKTVAPSGLIAGASVISCGEEVLHDLNGRSLLSTFLQVTEGTLNFRCVMIVVVVVIMFLRWTFVGVFVICLSLVLGSSRCPMPREWHCGLFLVMVMLRGWLSDVWS
jgi:hypothetical protein